MGSNQELEKLNQIIKEFNPFESNYIAKSHDIWSEDFLDVPGLHAHASDAIFEALKKNGSNHTNGKVTSIALLAQKGSGKSHLLGRVYHHIKRNGNAFFIYISEYGNLNSIKSHFLQAIASSLKKTGSKGVSQWQELATFLVNKATGKNLHPCMLLEIFKKALEKGRENPHKFIIDFNNLVNCVIHHYAGKIDNPYIIRGILWTLSLPYAPYAINWLAGKELSESYAKSLDLPAAHKESQEAEAFSKARQILSLISDYTMPVICFDELDGTEYAPEDIAMGGLSRPQVVCNLVKDINNNLKRGVLVTSLFFETWKLQIKVLEGIPDRVGGQEIILSTLKPDEASLLVATYLGNFYASHDVSPPHPVYPFDEKQLRENSESATVRDILQWCAKNFNAVEIDPIKQLQKRYQVIYQELEDYNEDNEVLAKALAFAFEYLQEKTIENVTILALDRDVKPKTKHKGYINFRILGEEDGRQVKIGVCVLQNSHWKTVGSAVGYLTQYKELDLTRGCLVRSRKIPDTWKVAAQNLDKLLHELGGEWVSFKDEEIRPLVSLYALFKEFDREVIPEEKFWEFVEQEHPLHKNSLICEILSDPSGQVPENVTSEEEGLEKLLSLETKETTADTEHMTAEDLDYFFSLDWQSDNDRA